MTLVLAPTREYENSWHPFRPVLSPHTHTPLRVARLCVLPCVWRNRSAEIQGRHRLAADTFVSVSCRCRSEAHCVRTSLVALNHARMFGKYLADPDYAIGKGGWGAAGDMAVGSGVRVRDIESADSPAAPIWALHTPDYNPGKESEREGPRGSGSIAISIHNSTCNSREFINTDRD